MKNVLRLVVVLLVLGGLAYSNPGEEDFREYIRGRVERDLSEDSGSESTLGRLFTDLGSSIVGSLAARVSERSNYVLFSTYAVDVGGDGEDDEAWKFIGIAGQFFETDSPGSDE